MIKKLIEGNTQHLTYMINFYKQKEVVRAEIEEIIARNNIRLLLLVAPPQDLPKFNDIQNPNVKRKKEFDHIIQ